MKGWTSAFVLVAAFTFVAAPRVWPHDGARDRAVGHVAAATPQPRSDAGQASTPTPGAAPALTHRQAVLDQFACADCHGVSSGWRMPEDHAAMPEGECLNCHRPVSSPPPITLHQGVSNPPTSGDCGLCHMNLVASDGPAPVSQGLCLQCHGAETNKVLPASHAARSDAPSTCIVCHETRSLEIPPVPHRTEGWEQCSFCHGPQRLTPLVGAHDYQASQQCLTCHDVIQPPDVSSELHAPSAETGQCSSCHAPGRVAPLPPSHDGRSDVLCGLCHRADKGPTAAPRAVTSEGP